MCDQVAGGVIKLHAGVIKLHAKPSPGRIVMHGPWPAPRLQDDGIKLIVVGLVPLLVVAAWAVASKPTFPALFITLWFVSAFSSRLFASATEKLLLG